ncbi:MAG TPA: GlsB/YeaQ/YmgE family stress response membrane protein [Candidatus Saccharimonadales bacterium]|nr:GlsB/YeaQ/YmgE family stress response membrane protein [Candidatus Saccharimonadales bacterium]
MILAIISWIILGALAGWIASLIMGMDEEQSGVMNVVVGILGAIIGGTVLKLVGGSDISGFNLSTLLTAILGSIILLVVIRGFRRSRTY